MNRIVRRTLIILSCLLLFSATNALSIDVTFDFDFGTDPNKVEKITYVNHGYRKVGYPLYYLRTVTTIHSDDSPNEGPDTCNDGYEGTIKRPYRWYNESMFPSGGYNKLPARVAYELHLNGEYVTTTHSSYLMSHCLDYHADPAYP